MFGLEVVAHAVCASILACQGEVQAEVLLDVHEEIKESVIRGRATHVKDLSPHQPVVHGVRGFQRHCDAGQSRLQRTFPQKQCPSVTFSETYELRSIAISSNNSLIRTMRWSVRRCTLETAVAADRTKPRQAQSSPATPRYATPRHATPRRPKPRHATPKQTTPNHTKTIFIIDFTFFVVNLFNFWKLPVSYDKFDMFSNFINASMNVWRLSLLKFSQVFFENFTCFFKVF